MTPNGSQRIEAPSTTKNSEEKKEKPKKKKKKTKRKVTPIGTTPTMISLTTRNWTNILRMMD